jgi:hypothetical protein
MSVVADEGGAERHAVGWTGLVHAERAAVIGRDDVRTAFGAQLRAVREAAGLRGRHRMDASVGIDRLDAHGDATHRCAHVIADLPTQLYLVGALGRHESDRASAADAHRDRVRARGDGRDDQAEQPHDPAQGRGAHRWDGT